MDIHEALKDELEKSNYIYLAFNDFYLPFKAKEPVHKIHINMIYGKRFITTRIVKLPLL